MISAFRRAGSFRGDSAVTTWLHRIVVNACLDRVRRRAARPEVPGGDERLLDTVARTASADPAQGSDLAVEVTAALRRLPHDQQVALVLVDMLGYPVAEAAQILGLAEGTVKSRCARGRARLLPRLAHLRQLQPGQPQPGQPQPGQPQPGQPQPGQPQPGQPQPAQRLPDQRGPVRRERDRSRANVPRADPGPPPDAGADGAGGYASWDSAREPGGAQRNRSASGSVLPEQEGGEEEA